MRFDDPSFLFQFLPAFLAVYFLVVGLDGVVPVSASRMASAAMAVLVAGSVVVIGAGPFGWLLLSAAAATFVAADMLGRTRGPSRTPARALLGAGIAANVAAFVYVRYHTDGRTFAFAGATVIACHGVALLIDIYRKRLVPRSPFETLLYLVQFPVLPAGPIVRAQEFGAHHLRLQQLVGLGAFTYGMRRVIIGLVKVVLVAGTLGGPVNAIFQLPPVRLGTGVAWLGAVAFSLQLYFQFSGFADIAIGLGRMFGLRYPENFRRPYLADSVREFWRRWNVTAITWLRDYLSLPMVGRDRPTPRLFANILASFALLAVWHGAGSTVPLWAAYAGGWLALEAVGLSTFVERWPRPLRHLYLLAIMLVGWVILRAESPAHAWVVLQALAGWEGATPFPASRFLSPGVWTALFVGIVGAGPLVPWISRWRVTLDAATAALVMMMTAVSVWIWRPFATVLATLRSKQERGSRF